MNYRTLGRTGIKFSPYCLGAMMFGGIANSDHDECIRITHKALDSGINFVDTADRYPKTRCDRSLESRSCTRFFGKRRSNLCIRRA